METFFNTHASAIFPIISSLVTLIIGYIYSTWSQSKKDKKELALKKLEQKYKISEEAYQKMFEKKIEVYNELHSILYLNKKELVNVGFIEHDYNEFNGHIEREITQEEIRLGLIRRLDEYSKKNIFYVSTELEEILLSLTSAINKDDKAFHFEMIEGYRDLSNLSQEEFDNNREFYQSFKSEIDKLIKLIEKEIREIKSKIDFD